MVLVLLSFGMSGCSSTSQSIEQSKVNETVQNVQESDKEFFAKSKEIANCYQKIYEQAVKDDTIKTLDTEKKIVKCLGNAGYVAVDDKNQIDMVNSDKVKEFVEKVDNKEEAILTIICVVENGGFVQFDFQTSEGEVHVTRSYLTWNGKTPEINSKEEYSAYTWVYSEEGYLFFEEYHMPGYDGPSGHTAIRVQHLDEKCRELNRQYILPIGYGSNNMFTTEWDENDFCKLNFYDLFRILYPIVYEKPIPYEVSYEGELYDVTQKEFEKVIMSYFKIDSETLQSKTKYLKEKQVYKYRTRGFIDWGWTPNTPYPEVVQFEENADGTIKLIVNVVYPEENLSCAYSHEVVVRPLSNGGIQYVSNHVIPSKKNIEPTWYTDQFTDEEWDEMYGELE